MHFIINNQSFLSLIEPLSSILGEGRFQLKKDKRRFEVTEFDDGRIAIVQLIIDFDDIDSIKVDEARKDFHVGLNFEDVLKILKTVKYVKGNKNKSTRFDRLKISYSFEDRAFFLRPLSPDVIEDLELSIQLIELESPMVNLNVTREINKATLNTKAFIKILKALKSKSQIFKISWKKGSITLITESYTGDSKRKLTKSVVSKYKFDEEIDFDYNIAYVYSMLNSLKNIKNFELSLANIMGTDKKEFKALSIKIKIASGSSVSMILAPRIEDEDDDDFDEDDI
jgi:hypothetical protein